MGFRMSAMNNELSYEHTDLSHEYVLRRQTMRLAEIFAIMSSLACHSCLEARCSHQVLPPSASCEQPCLLFVP